MQALQDLQLDSASTYNRTAASKWILDRQRTDGGWTEEPLQDGQDASIGVGLTADIVLALGCKGLGTLKRSFETSNGSEKEVSFDSIHLFYPPRRPSSFF